MQNLCYKGEHCHIEKFVISRFIIIALRCQIFILSKCLVSIIWTIEDIFIIKYYEIFMDIKKKNCNIVVLLYFVSHPKEEKGIDDQERRELVENERKRSSRERQGG